MGLYKGFKNNFQHNRQDLLFESTLVGFLDDAGLAFNSRGFFNILIYGADPTGVQDSTKAIQATIDACANSGGGFVIAPQGTYLITATLNKRAKVTVCGQGTGWYPFDGSQGGTVFKKGFNGDMFQASNVNAWGLRDLSLYGDKANFTGRGLNVVGTGAGRPRRWRLQNVVIMRTAGVGLEASQAGLHWADGCEILETADHSVVFADTSDYHWSNAEIGAAGESEAANKDAVSLGSNCLGHWTNVKFYQSYRNFVSASTVFLEGCTFEKARLWGAELGGNGSHITGSSFVRNGTSEAANSGGLFINNRARNVITGNNFNDPDSKMKYCVLESGASADLNCIVGNSFADYQTEKTSVVGAGTVVANNVG